MFISHRGNDNHNYRENSENAIIYSLNKEYIKGVECDIRLTKDNEIVLLHNMVIDLVSDGSGVVSNLTLKELMNYNFGNEKITVLSKLLSTIYTNKIILLEIKEERKDVINNWIKSLSKIINNNKNLNIYLCSFNYELIKELKKHFNKVGLIIGYTINKNKDITPFDFVMYQYKSFKYTHKMTMLWTINDKLSAIKLKNKCDYIITDNAYEFI